MGIRSLGGAPCPRSPSSGSPGQGAPRSRSLRGLPGWAQSPVGSSGTIRREVRRPQSPAFQPLWDFLETWRGGGMICLFTSLETASGAPSRCVSAVWDMGGGGHCGLASASDEAGSKAFSSPSHPPPPRFLFSSVRAPVRACIPGAAPDVTLNLLLNIPPHQPIERRIGDKISIMRLPPPN